jgi:hypothetical protein
VSGGRHWLPEDASHFAAGDEARESFANCE